MGRQMGGRWAAPGPIAAEVTLLGAVASDWYRPDPNPSSASWWLCALEPAAESLCLISQVGQNETYSFCLR